MFKNYIKIAYRNIWKNKKLSFINIFGLATGMACSLLIFIYVIDELSYDKFHQDANNIHRVVKDFIHDDGIRIPDATTQATLAPAMKREIPEVISVTRFFPSWGRASLVRHGERKFMEDKIWRIDSSFFEVFPFHFIKGSPQNALIDKNSIILTETTAKKYFGNNDPIGKTLNFNNEDDVTVSGVIEDVPANAHFHFDFLLPLSGLPAEMLEDWDSYNYYTYVKVKEGTDIKELEEKIQAVFENNQDTRFSDYYTQPLTEIHLTSNLKWELEPNGDKMYVYIFSIIGFFILLIAAINYINLSTAKSSLRAKEIGIRKVSGAVKTNLVRQFLWESIILCFISSLVALLMAEILLSTVNDFTGKNLSIIGNPFVLLYLFIATLLLGIVAGIFPALYLSSFKPVLILKGLKIDEGGALSLRKALVVVQFTISIVLIIGAIVITLQMKFMQSAKLGFDIDQVLVVKNAHLLSGSDRTAYLNSIKQLTGVRNAALAGSILGEGFGTSRTGIKGSDHEIQLNHTSVSFDYFEVMGIDIIEGRGFSSDFPADVISESQPEEATGRIIGSIVLNERAVKDFGIKPPVIGNLMSYGGNVDSTNYLRIVGIAKDFHFTSLRNEIKAFGFVMIPNWASNFTVKLDAHNIQSTLTQLEQEWEQISAEYPFEYTFLDETFARLYASEARFHRIFISLVILGIIIACLGLFGLATFAAEQRVKEIGIRKVLGASVINVVTLLSKDFLKLVLISLIIAVPIAWYVINQWLQDFTYRIAIEWWVFVLAALIAIVIALLTISSQAIKAAISNPVNSIRTE